EALKKKEKEEAEEAAREEYLAAREAEGSGLNTQGVKAPQQFALNTDNSWYFYNEATRNAGRTEFQRRWGSRKLEDDWRRRNKTTYTLEPEEETAAEEEESEQSEESGQSSPSDKPDKADAEAALRAADPHYPEYYIKQIPVTDVQKTTARDIIQEGLYNSGLILKDRLEDYSAADREWDRLMNEFPSNVYRMDVFHNRYLMYMRQGREDLAEPYRQLIISQFPDTQLAQAMADPAYLSRLKAMPEEQERLYDSTYAAYLDNRNGEVHASSARAEQEYPLSPLLPKFMFLDALAYVTEEKPEEFRRVLTDLLERYPDADVTPLAASWHQGLTQGRELHSSAGGNTRSMIWDIRLTNDSTLLASGEKVALEFTLEPEEPHYLVLLFEADRVAPNKLLYDVARHNFTTYTVKDFDLEVMNFGPLGLLVIKGFDNQAQLNHYRSLLARDAGVSLPSGVRSVEISKHNFDLLLGGGGSFDDYFRFIGEEEIRTTHE
ncbi:MAG: tetratricopeptide repeat protein, partial [Duncaniella sp.]|nr:tetratricopeptide repeat protein [Duncaniella sp.]